MFKNPNYTYGPRDINIPMAINLGEFIVESFEMFKGRTALINGATGEQTNYEEIQQKAISLAVSLTQLGVGKGQTVAICSENRPEFFISVIGAILTGAVVTPFPVMCTEAELKNTLSISKPTTVICSSIAYKLHEKSWKTSVKRIIAISPEKPAGVIWYSDLVSKEIKLEDFMAAPVTGQVDTAFILYSSGTTGLPKGARLSHYSGLVSCLSNVAGETLADVIRSMSVSPWYHAMGFFGSLTSLSRGRTIIYIPKFEEKLYLETIHKYKPHILTAPPPLVVLLSKSQLLNNYDISSVEAIYCGAAPLDIDTINEVKKRFPNLKEVMQGYGMTESTLAVTRDTENSPKGVKSKSVGVPCSGTIVKIVDIETRRPLKAYEKGEICVKGPIIMQGYVGKDNSEYFDEEGFYKTGDIGYYDEDRYFYIVDRLKELIKYKGHQVPPAELEAILLQHPSIRDAGVIGRPDHKAGELPMAFIVKQPNADVSEQDIVQFVKERVSNPKQLRGGVRFVNEIPKNPSGKILRKELRKILKSGTSKL